MRTNKDYIEDLKQSIEQILSFTKGMNREEFKSDQKTINAVIRSFDVMGEAAKNIDDSIKSHNTQIPFKQMAAMRDKLIHAYFGVDLEIIWETIQEKIPKLEKQTKEFSS